MGNSWINTSADALRLRKRPGRSGLIRAAHARTLEIGQW